jgi:hypothetical protein
MIQNKIIFGVILSLAIVGGVNLTIAQSSQNAHTWDQWQFLLGDWIGEGGGEPGQGVGEFSFWADLDGTVLMRRSYAEYPATQDRPASRHSDLMLVYQETGVTKAIYLDNEGHVINYDAYLSRGGDTLTFVSDPAPGKPRFRMTYINDGEAALKFKFEIAPPSKPDAFAPYIEATARRK